VGIHEFIIRPGALAVYERQDRGRLFNGRGPIPDFSPTTPHEGMRPPTFVGRVPQPVNSIPGKTACMGYHPVGEKSGLLGWSDCAKLISKTDGRAVGGRCPGWRGSAGVEFSSSCSEIAITERALFAAPDMGLLSFKSPELSWRQVAASIAAEDALLLLPLSLIDSSSPGRVSKHQEDCQAPSHRCQYSSRHVFVSILGIQSSL